MILNLFLKQSEDGRALKYALDDANNDRHVVVAAIIQKGWSFEYARRF